jgi:hypothetical protein
MNSTGFVQEDDGLCALPRVEVGRRRADGTIVVRRVRRLRLSFNLLGIEKLPPHGAQVLLPGPPLFARLDPFGPIFTLCTEVDLHQGAQCNAI